MTPEDIAPLFTNGEAFHCARWGRSIAPIVFGVDDDTLAMVKGGIEAVVALAGHKMAETDPELGVNLMVFFCRDWAELSDVPDLDALIPELATLVPRLQDAQAHQYRLFRFDDAGAIKACFVFLRMEGSFADLPVQTLALDQAVRSILTWGQGAFATTPPLMDGPDGAVLRHDIAALIRAAYDPVLPAQANDASHALRLFARMERPQ